MMPAANRMVRMTDERKQKTASTLEDRLHHELRCLDRALKSTAIASSMLFSFLAGSIAWLLLGT